MFPKIKKGLQLFFCHKKVPIVFALQNTPDISSFTTVFLSLWAANKLSLLALTYMFGACKLKVSNNKSIT